MDSGDQAFSGLYYLLLLVLVASALFARRIPIGRAMLMFLIWAVIFGLAFIAFTFRSDFSALGARLKAEAFGAPRQQVEGSTLRVALADDGHYWVSGTVNGVEARFLIDSGASFTALSEDLAHKAGLAMDPMRMAILHTANGTVNAGRSSIAELAVGPLQTRDLPVVVSASFGDVNVLGMNFLSKLKSWKVAGGELVLEP